MIVSTISCVEDHALVLHGLGARILSEKETEEILHQMRMLVETTSKEKS